MKRIILLYWPVHENRFQIAGWEMLGEALRLQADKNWEVQAVCFAENAQALLKEKPKLPIDKLYCMQTKQAHDIKAKALCIARLCREIEPSVFLFCATPEGRALAPMAAVYLQTGLTADCTALSLDEAGKLLQVRPAYEETLLATIETSTLPQMATVRQGVAVPMADCKARDTQIVEDVVEDAGTIRLLSTEPGQKSGIAEESILVAAGAGVKKEDLPVLQRYAECLGGQLASSRKLVERGWMPQERQIGLSGTAVCADLLVTVGVSGSIQFMAGIARVKKIIAINNDEYAPIFSIAQYPILMDADDFIKSLCEGERDETNHRTFGKKPCDSGY